MNIEEKDFIDSLTEVYEENFSLWSKRLTSFVGESLAEDAVQEGFCRSIIYQKAFNKSKASLAAWCWVIVMNAARDINASERTGETYSLHEELGNGEEKLTLEEVLGKPDNMDAEEFAEIVIEEIASDRLSATSQNILWLRLILGYNPRDIEKVLDTNNKAVRNCTHQFKVYLTEKYGYFK